MKTLYDIKDDLPIDSKSFINGANYIIMGTEIPLNTPLNEAKAILTDIKSKSFPDFKALSHALRAGYQARDIYKYGDFVYPLAETNFLKQVKQGKLDFAQVGSELERLVAEIENLSENSNLPEHVDTEFWDKWLLRVYAHEFGLNM
jgi:hypothetical protein